MITEALTLADNMIEVFPCHSIRNGACTCGLSDCTSPGKHPRIKGGFENATINKEQIKAWWKKWPDANIGIATGKRSGLWVLDVDGQIGKENLQRLAKENNAVDIFKNTWTAKTGTGFHLYFLLEDQEIKNSQSKIAKKIDVRADGGYVIAPPSVHQSGKKYSWLPGRSPYDQILQEAPEWLIALATQTPQKTQPPNPPKLANVGDIEKRAVAYVDSMPPAISGSGGHEATFDVAQVLIKGFALDYSTAWNIISQYNLRCVPPWSDKELDHKLKSAQTKSNRPLGYLLQDTHKTQSQPDLRQPKKTPPKPSKKENQIPTINISNKQDSTILKSAWNVIFDKNKTLPDPIFYNVNNKLVTLERQQNGKLSIKPVNEFLLRSFLSFNANWVKFNSKGGIVPASQPRFFAQLMLADIPEQIPILDAIVYSPIFDGKGRLINRRGFDKESCVYLDTDLEITLPKNIDHRVEERAYNFLVNDLLADFPFSENSSRAHALGALLLPFCRRMIQGPTPLYMISSSTPGTGKSLLAQVISVITTGEEALPATLPTRYGSEDEIRKKITSTLLTKPPLILWDNLQYLKADSLAAVITSQWWSDRVLGGNTMIQLKNDALWLATSNNPELSVDMSRRVCPINIDAEIERPEMRDNFKHDPLLQYCKAKRKELVTAILCLVEVWKKSGKPKAEKKIGSFESWSDVIGGITRIWFPDLFMKNFEILRSEADQESLAWGEIFDLWYKEFSEDGIAVSVLMRNEEIKELLKNLLGDSGHLGKRTGLKLRKLRGRVINGLRLYSERGRSNKTLFHIEKVKDKQLRMIS